jgi:hypothetical protein
MCRMYCSNCYYVIGLLSADYNSSARYSLVAAGQDAIINLEDGVPHSDTVDQGQYQYYRVILTSPNLDLEFTANPIYGDPDLYVSWNASNPKPDNLHFDARSMSMYNDSVYIQVCGECVKDVCAHVCVKKHVVGSYGNLLFL